MALRYPVYAWDSLQPAAYFLKLRDNGAQLNGAWGAFQDLESSIAVLNWYYALHGINILLLIARWVWVLFMLDGHGKSVMQQCRLFVEDGVIRLVLSWPLHGVHS